MLIINILKKYHILPVYRKDVLKYARKNKKSGLCRTLDEALDYFNVSSYGEKAFPLFNHENALKFGAGHGGYWWPMWVWTKRLEFLDWLIEQYKDDKTDLRYLQLKQKEELYTITI